MSQTRIDERNGAYDIVLSEDGTYFPRVQSHRLNKQADRIEVHELFGGGKTCFVNYDGKRYDLSAIYNKHAERIERMRGAPSSVITGEWEQLRVALLQEASIRSRMGIRREYAEIEYGGKRLVVVVDDDDEYMSSRGTRRLMTDTARMNPIGNGKSSPSVVKRVFVKDVLMSIHRNPAKRSRTIRMSVTLDGQKYDQSTTITDYEIDKGLIIIEHTLDKFVELVNQEASMLNRTGKTMADLGSAMSHLKAKADVLKPFTNLSDVY